MRKITKAVGLVALMAGARYVPLDWQGGPQHVPGPAIVTGSVAKAEDEKGSASRKPGLESSVRSILAEASSEQVPRTNNGPKAGGGEGGRSRLKRDEDFSEGIYTGGTGLLDEEIADPAKSHALAAANPDDYLVICEAGCRPANDRIVYRVSKIAAATTAIVQRRLELSSATAPAKNEDQTEAVVCVAGCYDDDEPKPSKRRAEQVKPAPVKLAQLEPQRAEHAAKAPIAAEVVVQTPADAAKADVEGKSAATADREKSATAAPDNVPAPVQVTAPDPAPVVVTADAAGPARAPVEAVPDQAAAQVHLISLETEKHLSAKRAKLALAQQPEASSQVPSAKYTGRLPLPPETPTASAEAASGWRTRVSSVVALRREPVRTVVALKTPAAAIDPFQTSISIEGGWDGVVANAQ